jgi:hypothetical protein
MFEWLVPSDLRGAKSMTSRERVRKALNHEVPDRVPLDLGSTPTTGIAATSLSKLRKALGLAERPVKVHEPYQILGMVEEDVLDALGVDVVGIQMPNTFFGYRNDRWKPWQTADGTDVLVGEGFTTTVDENGDTFIYPAGEITARPSGKMPKGGYYFDLIIRQEPIDADHLDPEEWMEGMFSEFTDEDLAYIEEQADYLYDNTERSIIGNFGQGGLGDIAMVPGPWVKEPKGIRDTAEWYMAPILYPEYVKGIFELQTEIALKNLELYRQAVGDKIEAIFISGTDFGAQNGPFISPDTYRDLFKPFHKRINHWVHENTNWKVFFHSCGSVAAYLDDFVEIGVDILNPVQTSAKEMDPVFLKGKYGEALVFWGGGIDTQRVLPFCTPEEVKQQVKERIEVFGRDGGFVFNTIHNIQPAVPTENLVALFEAVDAYRNLC